jgi:hypothetical protein
LLPATACKLTNPVYPKYRKNPVFYSINLYYPLKYYC